MDKSNTAAIVARVSSTAQETENQILQLQELARRRGLDVVVVYRIEESAWKGAHLKALSQVMDDAAKGRFGILLTWALDRLSRQGPRSILEIIHRLGQYGVQVVSLQEPWVEASGEMRELLLSIAGWVAQQESRRRSERTVAGLQRVRASGVRLGRPPGSKDRKKRSRRGYLLRYAGPKKGVTR